MDSPFTKILTYANLAGFVAVVLGCYLVLLWDFMCLDLNSTVIPKGYQLFYHWSGWEGIQAIRL